MWTNEHSVVTDATREQIWAIWEDIENWPLWDKATEWCKREGPFAVGTIYTLKPTNGPKVKAVMTSCDYLQGFSDVTRLPLARLEFVHTLSEQGDGKLKVTHRVNISGPLTFLFARVIGQQTVKGLPDAMQNLVALAQQKVAVSS